MTNRRKRTRFQLMYAGLNFTVARRVADGGGIGMRPANLDDYQQRRRPLDAALKGSVR